MDQHLPVQSAALHRHLLLTLSEEQSALHGVRFISNFFTCKEHVEVTLYATAAMPHFPGEFAPHRERAQGEQLSRKRAKQGAETLAQARDMLVARGFDPKLVHDRFSFRSTAAARDILAEGERGLYDAVILGRRGLSWIEELVENSVSRNLLDRELTFPLWVCRDPEPGRRHVLCCVDESDPAHRMVDHVGFMLADEPGHDVTLVNVYDPGSGDRVFAEAVFARCKRILTLNGVSPSRISTRMLESYHPARAILRLAERDKFAVVAAGRTGEDLGLARRLFMGSVSLELYRKLSGAALWLCR